MNFPKATFSCKSNERSFSKFTNISGEINSMTANLVEIESFDLPSVVKEKRKVGRKIYVLAKTSIFFSSSDVRGKKSSEKR